MTVTREQIITAFEALECDGIGPKGCHDSLVVTCEKILGYENFKAIRTVLQSALDEMNPHTRCDNIDEEYDTFWKGIIEKDGVIDKQQLKKELYDFSYLMEHAGSVYYEVTNGRLSQLFYPSSTVIGCYNDYIEELQEEWERDQEELRDDTTPDTAALDALLKLSEFCTLSTHETCTLRETIRAALTRPSVGWMPIETAPKDGTFVITSRLVRYLPYKKDGARQMGKKGRWQEWNGYGWNNCKDEPSEYMPLPAAPKEGE